MTSTCTSTMAGKARRIIAGDRPTMGSKVSRLSWGRAAGWVTRLILFLFLALEASIWLDVYMQPEEYERLIGSESACGMFESYCSWQAYVLDNVPFMALSGLAIIGLLWRGLPRRELALGVLALVICLYLAWRAYSTLQHEIGVSGHCCQKREHSQMAMHW